MSKALSSEKIALVGILTAVVVIMQSIGAVIRFGPFSISLVLIPIVVGAAAAGPWVGAWLGLVFSVIVLFTDSAAFLAINAPATIVLVLVKGTAAGYCAGLAYKALEGKGRMLAASVAALVCPIVNTGIFLIGARLFFFETIREWASAFGFENAYAYMIFGMVGANFLVEAGLNLLLSPQIVRLIEYYRGRHRMN